MITDTKQGACTAAQTPCLGAEARGFEPRMGVNPNRISSALSGRPAECCVVLTLRPEAGQGRPGV